VFGVDSAEIFVIAPSFIDHGGDEDKHPCALIGFYFASNVKIGTYQVTSYIHIYPYKYPEHYIFYIITPCL